MFDLIVQIKIFSTISKQLTQYNRKHKCSVLTSLHKGGSFKRTLIRAKKKSGNEEVIS